MTALRSKEPSGRIKRRIGLDLWRSVFVVGDHCQQQPQVVRNPDGRPIEVVVARRLGRRGGVGLRGHGSISLAEMLGHDPMDPRRAANALAFRGGVDPRQQRPNVASNASLARCNVTRDQWLIVMERWKFRLKDSLDKALNKSATRDPKVAHRIYIRWLRSRRG